MLARELSTPLPHVLAMPLAEAEHWLSTLAEATTEPNS